MEKPRHPTRKKLSLNISHEDHATFLKEAESAGCDLPTLFRLKIFGKAKGLRTARKPTIDRMLLGDSLGKLACLTSEINKIGLYLNQIAKSLNQGSRDLFGLDSCLRLFESLGQKILRALASIEAALLRKKQSNTLEEDQANKQ